MFSLLELHLLPLILRWILQIPRYKQTCTHSVLSRKPYPSQDCHKSCLSPPSSPAHRTFVQIGHHQCVCQIIFTWAQFLSSIILPLIYCTFSAACTQDKTDDNRNDSVLVLCISLITVDDFKLSKQFLL